MSVKIRENLKAVANDPALLKRLISEPISVAKEFKLNRAETARLAHSDVLMARAHNPLVEIAGAMITLKGTVTRTSTRQSVGGDSDPVTLEGLSHERLLEVTQRILVEPDYAMRVRAFLKL